MASPLPYLRIPHCPGCNREYNVYENAPYILPCCHTFCWKCISSTSRQAKQQRNTNLLSIFQCLETRRCPICWEKFASYQLNLASLDYILQLKLLTVNLVSCNECLKQVPSEYLRRCLTCEREVRFRVNFPRVSCVVCLECALNTHQGHELRKERSGEIYQNDAAVVREGAKRSHKPSRRAGRSCSPHSSQCYATGVGRGAERRRENRRERRATSSEGLTNTRLQHLQKERIMEKKPIDYLTAAFKSLKVKTEKATSLACDLSSRCVRELRSWKGSSEFPIHAHQQCPATPTINNSFCNIIGGEKRGGGVDDNGGFDVDVLLPPIPHHYTTSHHDSHSTGIKRTVRSSLLHVGSVTPLAPLNMYPRRYENIGGAGGGESIGGSTARRSYENSSSVGDTAVMTHQREREIATSTALCTYVCFDD